MKIEEQAKQLKYIKNNLETTLHLTEVLQSLYEDNYLKEAILLKGGAAIQLYLQNFSRLFFDLDIDFTLDITEKANFKQYLIQYLQEIGYKEISLKKSRSFYSLDSLQFPYYLENGNLNYLKLDINYSYGNHLYLPTKLAVTNQDFNLKQTISLVNLEELISLKMAALQDRGNVKDLFDIYQILTSSLTLDIDKVKSAYLFYMTIAEYIHKIKKTEKITEITNHDMKKTLYPALPKQNNPNLELMKQEVLSFVKECSILNSNNQQFIKNFKKGYLTPEYLFTDKQIIENALNNPIAKWKIKLMTRR